jgi:hypothetical protein
VSEQALPGVVDEDGEHRDIYAYFGLAYYLSECVHRGLVTVFAHGSGPSARTRPWLEEQFTRGEAMTLGEIAQASAPFLPPELQEAVRALVTERNYLAHGFWYERIHETQSVEGRQVLLEFLKSSADRFRLVSDQLDDLLSQGMKELGISAELFDAVYEDSCRGPPPKSVDGRLLRADERIRLTDAWLISSGAPEKEALILRDVDGKFWQLGELGIGWSFRGPPTAEWRVYKRLQALLPADIVCRPRRANPWNYQLHLSTGALLSVTRSPAGLLTMAIRSVPRR